MIDRYKDKPTLQWQQMNVTSLEFPDETFDVVIAKATLDAVLCGEGILLFLCTLPQQSVNFFKVPLPMSPSSAVRYPEYLNQLDCSS